MAFAIICFWLPTCLQDVRLLLLQLWILISAASGIQKNISTISGFGNSIIEPNEGELASGLEGKGRMAEPEEIFEFTSALLNA